MGSFVYLLLGCVWFGLCSEALAIVYYSVCVYRYSIIPFGTNYLLICK